MPVIHHTGQERLHAGFGRSPQQPWLLCSNAGRHWRWVWWPMPQEPAALFPVLPTRYVDWPSACGVLSIVLSIVSAINARHCAVAVTLLHLSMVLMHPAWCVGYFVNLCIVCNARMLMCWYHRIFGEHACPLCHLQVRKARCSSLTA